MKSILVYGFFGNRDSVKKSGEFERDVQIIFIISDVLYRYLFFVTSSYTSRSIESLKLHSGSIHKSVLTSYIFAFFSLNKYACLENAKYIRCAL